MERFISNFYLITRYYDSTIGRFILPDDPKYLDFEVLFGCNRFAYCLDNPTKNQDSEGEFWFTFF